MLLAPLFCLFLLTGFVLVVIWASRFATKHQLKTAISWFLGIGIAGALLSGGLAFRRSGKAIWDAPLFRMGVGWLKDSNGNAWLGCPYARQALSNPSDAGTLPKW